MFNVALFVPVGSWSQPKHLTLWEWINIVELHYVMLNSTQKVNSMNMQKMIRF